MTREDAWSLLTEYTQSESLRKHALAVEACMLAYARKFGEDENTYSLTGLLHDFDYEKYPTAEATEMFLKTVNDPATGKFYVHCAGGRHSTGAMGALYRVQFYNWNFDQVYKEMKQYDFYTRWGHGAFKDFVEDYYSQMQQQAKGAGK